jgi:hypothetical protein
MAEDEAFFSHQCNLLVLLLPNVPISSLFFLSSLFSKPLSSFSFFLYPLIFLLRLYRNRGFCFSRDFFAACMFNFLLKSRVFTGKWGTSDQESVQLSTMLSSLGQYVVGSATSASTGAVIVVSMGLRFLSPTVDLEMLETSCIKKRGKTD